MDSREAQETGGGTATAVCSRETLVTFVGEIVQEWGAAPSNWTNQTAGEFVEALAAWLADMDGYYARFGTTADVVSPWRVIADAIAAARFYE